MTRSRCAAAAAVVAAIALAPSSAGAAPRHAPRYSSFGNVTLGDCDFASAANLVQWKYPGAKITTREVVEAWRSSGSTGLDYLETSGFAGHRIASYYPVTDQAGMIAAVRAGGVQATILGGAHAVAVIGASSSGGVVYVMDGRAERDTWAQWRQDTHGLWAAWGVTWGAPGTTALEFRGSYETDAMVDQVEPTGTVAPIEPLGMVNEGYHFDGWALNANETGPLLQSGQLWTFTRGATLWAVWTYLGATGT